MDIETKTAQPTDVASTVDADKKAEAPHWQGLRRVPDKLPLVALLILVVEVSLRVLYLRFIAD